MFFLRRFVRRLLIVFLIGFIVRKLLDSSDPRARRVGEVANRLMGSRFTAEGTRPRQGRRLSRGRTATRV